MCFKAKVFVSLYDQRNKMIPPLFSILRESMVTSFRDSETYRIVSLVFMIHGMCGWIFGNEVVGGICELTRNELRVGSTQLCISTNSSLNTIIIIFDELDIPPKV